MRTTLTTLLASRAYPIGKEGTKWGPDERAAWLASNACSTKRSYQEEVVTKVEALREQYDVIGYGALSIDPERFPLYAVKSRGWDKSKKTVLVTGGVHGYETSGVQGAITFLRTAAHRYTHKFNLIVAPCVSPWGYEAIQRWNAQAIDPNRSFGPTPSEGPAEEAVALSAMLESAGVDTWAMHIDLHETTDTDESEFRPAKAARNGDIYKPGTIPDGFYLVGNSANPQSEWHKAIIDSVRTVTHIAPADDDGKLIGEPILQEGVINYPARQAGLCMGVTDAPYATTTEVYPDSPRATPEQCNEAQVAAVTGALDFILRAEGACDAE